jgi:hypothetical protein
LSGGASAQNVYWQVGSSATVEVGTAMQGNILALTSISLKDNASLAGRALARNGAVTLGTNNRITVPGGSGSGTVGALATITVTPNPDTLFFNQTQQFTAVGRDANGNVVPITPTWDVGDAGTISNTGLFTAGTMSGYWLNGIAARSGGISGYASIKVKKSAPGILATITVTPNPDTLFFNQTQQFTAVGRDADGNVVAITPSWDVGDAGTITNTGLFTAGTMSGYWLNGIAARSGGISGYASVKVKKGPVVEPPASDTLLGQAGLYGILAGTTVTCINSGIVLGDVGLWPGSAITGFPPCQSSPTPHAADDAAKAAQDALTAAYIRLNNLPCVSNLSADLGGQTLQPGVYCSLELGLTGEVFVDALGDPNAIFVIKAASTLTTAGARVTLLNNAQARNIYWVVGSSATVGTGSAMKGNILALTSITLMSDATLSGRALARNGAVTMGTNNHVTLP